MAIREGRWDCPSCGKTGILGRYRECDSCGNARPEGVRFYLPDDAAGVTDAQLLSLARGGVDWTCSYCGRSNRNTDETCAECGAPQQRGSAQATQDYDLSEVPHSGEFKDPDPVAPQPQPQSSGRNWVGAVMWTVLAVALGIGAVELGPRVFQPRQVNSSVQSLSWERSIQIQAYKTVQESGWSLPPSARVISQSREIREYRDVLSHHETRTREVSNRVKIGEETYVCGQRDLGNGFFEDKMCTRPVYETRTETETYEEPIYRQEPVYGTRYRYEIDKWVPTRRDIAAGDHRRAPAWPQPNLGPNEREGRRSESYQAVFVDEKGEAHTLSLSAAQWSTFEIGESQTLERSLMGQVKLPTP